MYLHIVVSINGNELHRYSFTESEVLIGRSTECDVILDNPGVSRTHAKILQDGSHIKIVDLQSGNGTFVNGQWASDALVTETDTIGIGKFTLSVKLSQEALTHDAPAPSADADTVISNTVFLRPDETRRILQQAQSAKPAPAAAPATTRPAAKREPAAQAQPVGWIFAAGAVVGLFLGWLFWA